jgi:hypothetical protein
MVWQLLLGCRACLLCWSRARTLIIAGTTSPSPSAFRIITLAITSLSSVLA